MTSMSVLAWFPLPSSPIDILAYLAFIVSLVFASRAARKRRTYPPGPLGWPVIGSALQVPARKYWLKFAEWQRIYGDIFQFSSLGETTIILGSAKAASELLEGRGAIYSDRPLAVMAGELVGWDLGIGYARFAPSSAESPPTTTNSPYPVRSNARFRTMRKLSHAAIGPQACAQPDMIAMQEQQRTRLIIKIVELGRRHKEGCDFEDTIKLAAASLVLKITYGYQVTSDKHDKLVEIADHAMAGFGAAASPGAFWADYLPILKRVPAWLPGAGFQKAAQRMRAAREKLYDVPFELVKRQMVSNTVPPSMVSKLLVSEAHSPADEELVKAIAASLYSASVETTQSSLMSFLLAMLLYPDVQRRAQAELDTLLGPPSSTSGSRMPSVHDRANLPYINALLKEVWRWNPSVPVGLPHRVTQDDVYRGFFIRKGTTVYPNIWSILHDPESYPSPFEFIPDRFLNEDGTPRTLERTADPGWIAFGFGRRICPGMHIADSSIFLYIASMLHLFDVVKAKNEDGSEIEPRVEYDGFISQSSSFKCRLVPRSVEAEDMIAREEHDMLGCVV